MSLVIITIKQNRPEVSSTSPASKNRQAIKFLLPANAPGGESLQATRESVGKHRQGAGGVPDLNQIDKARTNESGNAR